MENSILRQDSKDLIMDDSKKSQLEKAGFQVGSIADFLNLSQEEQAKIDNIIIRRKIKTPEHQSNSRGCK